MFAWVTDNSHNWKTFVTNHVSEFQRLTSDQNGGIFKHDNPADVISRGCAPIELKSNNMWWYPLYLLPRNINQLPSTCIRNIKKLHLTNRKKSQ